MDRWIREMFWAFLWLNVGAGMVNLVTQYWAMASFNFCVAAFMAMNRPVDR